MTVDSTPHEYRKRLLSRESACFCRPLKRIQHHHRSFLHVSYTVETTTAQQHQKGCNHYSSYPLGSATRKIKVRCNGLRNLCGRALELSIILTSGAGGLSISPNITVRPMVDASRSPLFRTMGLLLEVVHLFVGGPEVYIELAIKRICRLIHQGKCSPYEVDQYGSSVLHRWTLVSKSHLISLKNITSTSRAETSTLILLLYEQFVGQSPLEDNVAPCLAYNTHVLLQAGLSASSVDSLNE